MRMVRVGAIQPEYCFPSAACNCLSEEYKADVDMIVDQFIKKRLAVTLELLNRAGELGLDIVTTSEDICGTGPYIADVSERNLFDSLLEATAPLAERELAEIARHHGMAIVGCYNRRTGGRNYNVASIFNRQGDIVGEYRKTHLPPDEMWQITPGDELSVFDLDFGRVGICICYDMVFPEAVREDALKGAEIIFHPTVGYGWYDSIGEATLRTRANDNGVHIVTAKNYVRNAAGKSSIIDFWGQVRADAGFTRNAVVTGELDLDERKLQPEWFNPTQVSGIADVQERMNRGRRP
ncbi:MAG TPA: carbon-nitrogen hydrolase family protein, partial [Clostridia bacterium]|nr:carbon-nitrogen hydrolase family protein [Clostridia bacterium]